MNSSNAFAPCVTRSRPFCNSLFVRRAGALERATPILFGPCTLVRTWGTRPQWSGNERLFEAEAGLSEHNFIPLLQSDPLARALRDWDHGAFPDDRGSVGASIIEEAEHTLFWIVLNVGMGPRNGWVGSVPVVSECHVIFSCEPSIRVDNFPKTSQVYALLLQTELLLLGRSGDDGEPDLRYLSRSWRGWNASVVHIKPTSGHIRRQFRHQFYPHS